MQQHVTGDEWHVPVEASATNSSTYSSISLSSFQFFSLVVSHSNDLNRRLRPLSRRQLPLLEGYYYYFLFIIIIITIIIVYYSVQGSLNTYK